MTFRGWVGLLCVTSFVGWVEALATTEEKIADA
jgi:hypothetical protein